MQSDDRVALAIDAVAGNAEAFRSAIATTVEQVRCFLAEQGSSPNGRVERFTAELGSFAVDRIDTERFARLMAHDNGISGIAVKRIERAFEILSGLIAEKESLFHVRIQQGGDLRDAVAEAMRHLGTAFGAARVVTLSRSGDYEGAEHAKLLKSFPFERWNSAERQLAPPLVVELRGSDLRPAGLADFLDGAQKVVLIVTGECPPAALVRLVSPGIFVLQTVDGNGLDRLTAWDGPGVVALVPDSAARFIHDPSAGGALGDRVRVNFLPDASPRRTIAGLSAAQQADELAQLTVLSTLASGVPAGVADAAAVPADPAEKLAAWLLNQASGPDSSLGPSA
jgi:hypothetical protein